MQTNDKKSILKKLLAEFLFDLPACHRRPFELRPNYT